MAGKTNWAEELARDVTRRLRACESCSLKRKGPQGEYALPSRKAIHDVLDTLVGVLFPGCHGHGPGAEVRDEGRESQVLRGAAASLREQAGAALEYACELDNCLRECKKCDERARAVVEGFLKALPEIRELLQGDIQAAYEGDPAARSTMEVVMSYPAIQAIAAHRIAHVLYEQGVPIIPRVMAELAHSRTGIDIHPGAKIGRSFFIDHGTGVVIGETSVLGEHVKIYQGVTLGALSFPKGPDGKLIKGIKRHPNVGDNVTIYAEATILGDVTIGEGSEIGGNVWLTHSVPPGSRVYNRQPRPEVRPKRK